MVTSVVPLSLSTDRTWAALAAYGVRTPAEVLAEEGDRDLFLIDGILHSGLTLLYGESEIGKSHLVVSMTTAVAWGRDWMVHRTNGGPGKVVVLASDPGDVLEYARRLGDTDTESVGVTRPPGPDDATHCA